MTISKSGNRDIYYDILRAVAILMVIAIHTYPSGGSIDARLVIRQTLHCAVPIFLAISGYFIGRKTLNTQSAYGAFLKRQLPRVYVPMLLWSLPWVALLLVKGMPPQLVVAKMFLGNASMIYYFIVLIIQLYLLTPVIQRLNLALGGGIPLL